MSNFLYRLMGCNGSTRAHKKRSKPAVGHHTDDAVLMDFDDEDSDVINESYGNKKTVTSKTQNGHVIKTVPVTTRPNEGNHLNVKKNARNVQSSLLTNGTLSNDVIKYNRNNNNNTIDSRVVNVNNYNQTSKTRAESKKNGQLMMLEDLEDFD